MAGEDQSVTYSPKELFEKIDDKLSSIVSALDGKANEIDLISLRAKVQELDQAVAILRTNVTNNKWTIAQVIIPVASIIAATLTIIFLKR